MGKERHLVVELRVGDAIKERGLTQKEVAEMTGIRPAAISQLSRGYIERLNLDHIGRIATALKIEDINELMTLQLAENIDNFPPHMYKDENKDAPTRD